MLFCRLLIFFKINFLRKNLAGIPSECHTVRTLIRPDESSGMIWVQTVCQGYHQTTLVDKELKHARRLKAWMSYLSDYQTSVVLIGLQGKAVDLFIFFFAYTKAKLFITWLDTAEMCQNRVSYVRAGTK